MIPGTLLGRRTAVSHLPHAAAAELCLCSPVCGCLCASSWLLVGGEIAPHLRNASTADGAVARRSHLPRRHHTLLRGSRLQLSLGFRGLACVWGCSHSRPACLHPLSGLGLCSGSCVLLRTGWHTPRSSVALPLQSGCHPGHGMRSRSYGPGLGTNLQQSFIPVGRRESLFGRLPAGLARRLRCRCASR